MNERVEFCMTVPEAVSERIEREARKRGLKPADLAEKVLEVAFGEDLAEAILDGGA